MPKSAFIERCLLRFYFFRLQWDIRVLPLNAKLLTSGYKDSDCRTRNLKEIDLQYLERISHGVGFPGILNSWEHYSILAHSF